MSEKATVIKEFLKAINPTEQEWQDFQKKEKSYNDFVLEWIEELKSDSSFAPYIESISSQAKDSIKNIDGEGFLKNAVKRCRSLFNLLIDFLGLLPEFNKKNNLINIKFISFIILIRACLPHLEKLTEKSVSQRRITQNQQKYSYQNISTEKHTLTFAIPFKEADLKETLKTDGKLIPQTAETLFRVKEWILYISENEWKNNCQELFLSPAKKQDDHDVYYIMIRMDKPDDRFGKNSSMMKMYDALKELARTEPEVKISERQPKESYENKGFYRV